MFSLIPEEVSRETAYEIFRRELLGTLHQVFAEETAADAASEVPEAAELKESMLLKHTVTTVAHKIYLDKYFKYARQEDDI